MSVTFSNGATCHFSVVLDNYNARDKFLLMMRVSQDGKDNWTTSCYEDSVSECSNFVARCVVGNSAVTSDSTKVASLLYMVVAHARKGLESVDS